MLTQRRDSAERKLAVRLMFALESAIKAKGDDSPAPRLHILFE